MSSEQLDVAVAIGHRSGSQGATDINGLTEWRYHSELASQLSRALSTHGIRGGIFNRPNHLPNYAARMGDMIMDINASKAKMVVALHFNAAPSDHTGEWDGAEVWHHPQSTKGEAAAEAILQAVANGSGVRARQTRGRTTNWSGARLYILTDTKAPAVLVESHYGDHAGDVAKAMAALQVAEGAEYGSLASSLASTIKDCLGVWHA